MYCWNVFQRDDVPVSSSNINVEMVKAMLLEHHRDYMSKTQQYDELYEKHSRITQEIQLKQQALGAFRETVDVFKDQIKLHETFQKQAQPHEVQK